MTVESTSTGLSKSLPTLFSTPMLDGSEPVPDYRVNKLRLPVVVMGADSDSPTMCKRLPQSQACGLSFVPSELGWCRRNRPRSPSRQIFDSQHMKLWWLMRANRRYYRPIAPCLQLTCNGSQHLNVLRSRNLSRNSMVRDLHLLKSRVVL